MEQKATAAFPPSAHFCTPFMTDGLFVCFPYSEYAAINSMLDQINSCLDHLEEKNDHLHARLKELLESNRQTRLEFQQQLSKEGDDSEADTQRLKPDP